MELWWREEDEDHGGNSDGEKRTKMIFAFKLARSSSFSTAAGTGGLLEAAVRQVFLWCKGKRGQGSGFSTVLLSCGNSSSSAATRIYRKNSVGRYVLGGGGAEESLFSSTSSIITPSSCGWSSSLRHLSWAPWSSVRWVSSSSREIKEEEVEDEIDPLSGSSEKTLLSTKPSTSSSSSSQAPSAQPDCEYHFSYTEIPRVAPIAYREQPQFSPFGPGPPDNPWIEKPSRRSALPEFNSFAGGRSSPGGLKAGRKAVKTREEILGEPLTKRGVKDLVELCDKENRQINLGRDGLTHNMLDLVHQHWRRRRVCKVTCKGVPTVDMDNVCNKLEEKTGGQIIHRKGGVVYLFRGRHYDHKSRPQIRLMLWKPPPPIYPPLIRRVPEGLLREEVDAMRKAGHDLPALCRLAKNGTYLTLVKDVRKAMKTDELVKVDCKGLNPSDMKRIGAKLKELVPCVLLSFDKECILMWRGRNLQSNTDDDEQDGSRKPSEVLLSEEGKEILHQALCKDGDFILNFEESNKAPTTDAAADSTHDTSSELLLGQVMSVRV